MDLDRSQRSIEIHLRSLGPTCPHDSVIATKSSSTATILQHPLLDFEIEIVRNQAATSEFR